MRANTSGGGNCVRHVGWPPTGAPRPRPAVSGASGTAATPIGMRSPGAATGSMCQTRRRSAASRKALRARPKRHLRMASDDAKHTADRRREHRNRERERERQRTSKMNIWSREERKRHNQRQSHEHGHKETETHRRFVTRSADRLPLPIKTKSANIVDICAPFKVVVLPTQGICRHLTVNWSTCVVVSMSLVSRSRELVDISPTFLEIYSTCSRSASSRRVVGM